MQPDKYPEDHLAQIASKNVIRNIIQQTLNKIGRGIFIIDQPLFNEFRTHIFKYAF